MTVSTFSVADMHCTSCVAKVEHALRGARGVESTHVNAARRLVLVDHASDVDPVALLQLIEDAGFQPSLARIDAGNGHQRDLLKRLGIAGLGMMQVMMFAIALYAGAFTGMDEASRRLLELASLVFCIPVVCYSAVPFFRSALGSLFGSTAGTSRSGGLSMDVPIALAIAAAFSVSLLHTMTGSGEVYYDSVVMFTFLLLAARYVDDRLKTRFDDANTSLAALPDHALVLDDGDRALATPLNAIAPGSRVWVEQGNRVPLDGDVVQGTATLDESALTGESDWVRRTSGERVFAGTVNQGAGFAIRTTAALDDTRIAGIADLAARAQADKPAVAELVDGIARRFVPAVLTLAAFTWLAWQLVDPSRSFVAALTVLVVSCPCALSLATPAAITAAMTRLRQSGIVLTRSAALEQVAGVDAAILDKTGTLTVHDPVLAGITWLADIDLPHADPGRLHQVQVLPGAGVEGRYGERVVRIGHAAFCGATDADERAVYLAVDATPVARFAVSDPLRPDAASAVAGLRAAGLEVSMVSGDAPERCAELAAQLGIGYVARQAPETKLALIRAQQRGGRRVLVLGDGINDVPALAAADVSAAVLESSDLVKSRADVLLLGRRLGALVDLVKIGRRARRIVRQNLGWALAYNLTAIPLAALGLMPPWLAALGMAGSSVLVMGNAARLLRASRPGVAGAAGYLQTATAAS